METMEDSRIAYCKLTPKQRQERGCKLDKRICQGCSYFNWLTDDDLHKSQNEKAYDDHIINTLWK